MNGYFPEVSCRSMDAGLVSIPISFFSKIIHAPILHLYYIRSGPIPALEGSPGTPLVPTPLNHFVCMSVVWHFYVLIMGNLVNVHTCTWCCTCQQGGAQFSFCLLGDEALFLTLRIILYRFCFFNWIFSNWVALRAIKTRDMFCLQVIYSQKDEPDSQNYIEIFQLYMSVWLLCTQCKWGVH